MTRPAHPEPGAWVALIVMVLLTLASLMSMTACGKKTPRTDAASPSGSPTWQPPAAPASVDEARQRQSAAEAQATYWRSIATEMAAAERQAQLEKICSIVRWLSLLGLFGSVGLHVLAWVYPALKPLRAISGMGAAAAVAVLALAWVLPTWGPWLFWVALVLTIGGTGCLVYRLVRTGNGLRGAVLVAEKLKDLSHVTRLSPSERRDLQRNIAGNGTPAIDEQRKDLGIL